MLRKETFLVPRISSLRGFLRQNAEDFSKILTVFPAPYSVYVGAHICTCTHDSL